jgi:hypothetical protein
MGMGFYPSKGIKLVNKSKIKEEIEPKIYNKGNDNCEKVSKLYTNTYHSRFGLFTP